jgi:hypothetical protein
LQILGETTKNLRIIDNEAEILFRYLRITGLVRYRCANRLGWYKGLPWQKRGWKL